MPMITGDTEGHLGGSRAGEHLLSLWWSFSTFAETLCCQHWLLLHVADGLGTEVVFVQPPPLVAVPQPGLRRQNPFSSLRLLGKT